ncbi:DUF6449 domain-containing protein [Cytobacillus sp. NCCP-133]|uniref:DUF6449 domain-containing protein n=1 Tax=Cytobacillus sp. NCCP-133 TaxID=766848 RepID=UPI002230959E|nr:DUF6449 domain-containing protein [Cytobacillus sp. NCCP-133]GLB59508.1 hypothetical protein NCCP133_16410 [Cytobacillus sp. NCCP-133]
MQSKISLVNKEIGKTIARSVGWVSIVYFLVLFFAVPLEIIMTSSAEQRKFIDIDNLFQYHFQLQIILNIAIPVVMSVFLFRFLQVKQYSDLIHSLPVKRESIFHQYAIAGFFLLVLPVFLISIIVLILYQPLYLNEFYSLGEIFKWLGITILYNAFIYFAGVFVGMVTGLSAVQGTLTYILLLLPVGLIILLAFNLPFYVYGYPSQYYLESKFEKFSPLVSITQMSHRSLLATEIIIYLILLFSLYWLSLWIYRKRKLEAVSQALVFPITKPIFKYGAAFCSMLLGGMYFGEMRNGMGWLIAGYVFGALLGFVIAEMVLQKSWRVSIHIKGLVIYTAAMAVLFILFQFDLTQYEKNIPAANEIERVHFSESFYLYSDADQDEPIYLKDYANIDLVRRLHKEIVGNKDMNKLQSNNQNTAFIVYELKNGEKLVRNYRIDKSKYHPFYKLIFESAEYKMATNEIYNVAADETTKITITPSGPVNKQAVITDPEDITATVEILTEEVDSAAYDDSQIQVEPYAYIEIFYSDNKKAYMHWDPSYIKFEKWLKEKSLLDKARVTGNDISYALAAKAADIDIDYARGYSYEEIFEEMNENPLTLKITDKDQIESSIKNAKGFIDGDYIIAFYFDEQRSIDIKSFNEKDVPDFLKRQFE